jgi:hypothetical protein
MIEMRDKPRLSGWGRIARTAKPSSGKIQLPEGLRQGMPDVKSVERM